MTTSSAAEKVAGSGVGEKKEESKVEKRRALGRGLGALLPGPRVVGSPESRVASPEAAPQGLKPGSSSALDGTAEAAPFPSAVPGGSGGGAGETKIPRFARDDKSSDEPPALPELEASRTEPALSLPKRVSDPHEPVPTYEPLAEGEVISIQAVADDRIVGNRVAFIPIELIDKNPYQTRYVFEEETLWELRDSIKEHGVVQPVVVRPAEEEGRFILVLGERRLRASKMAGKDTIPALVRRLSPQQA